jgi:uncharacterized Zn-binding protein involved in type VI secretion
MITNTTLKINDSNSSGNNNGAIFSGYSNIYVDGGAAVLNGAKIKSCISIIGNG